MFQKFFSDAEAFTAKMDIEITRPRTVLHQTDGDNVTAGSNMEFVKSSFSGFGESVLQICQMEIAWQLQKDV